MTLLAQGLGGPVAEAARFRMRFDARQQLAGAERLDQTVVGPVQEH